MNRENTGAKPTAPPRLPPEAEQEILEALFRGNGDPFQRESPRS